MSQLDAGEPTEAEAWADRVEFFCLARKTLERCGWSDLTVEDVLELARFLAD